MSLTLIIGPMKSGKSLELIARLGPYQFTDKRLLFVQPLANVRDDAVISRSGVRQDATKVASLADVDSAAFDVIGIDEVHMFPEDDWQVVQQWLLDGKDIVASGLDLDYRAKLIPLIARLLELKPEQIIDRQAVCELCKQYQARFTQVLRGNEVARDGLPPVVPDDGTYNYRPVCRTCYQK